MTSADLLLHPVRLRINEAFLGERKLTTAELRAELPDVPPASLYRHLTRLIDAGVLDVVSERKVRGTLERTYIRPHPQQVGPAELARMSRDDHRRAFRSHVAALLADIDGYLDRDDIDLHRDGVAYRIMGIWLSDQELAELAGGFARLLQPYLDQPATPQRSRRILRIISLPGADSCRQAGA